MKISAKQIADNASYQAFVNCYLREVDTGVWHLLKQWQLETGLKFDSDENYVLELQLQHIDIKLAIGVSFRSLVGRHKLTKVYQQQKNSWDWQLIDSFSAINLLINNIYAKAKSLHPYGAQAISNDQLELVYRTIESHQIMAYYLEQRINDSRLHSPTFIDSEQAILFGHWLHPTPKSRQGMHQWQHECYTPELCSEFQLHFFSVDKSLISQGSMLNDSAEEIIEKIFNQREDQDQSISTQKIPNNHSLIPVHPLQGQWLLHQPNIKTLMSENKLVDMGLQGPKFTPTSSVRTLYCEKLDFMLKLSLPVKITNSMRINKAHELNAGISVAKLLEHYQFSKQYPHFKTLNDPAYMTVNMPGQRESGFETIIRENPFSGSVSAHGIQSIAALVQDPLNPADTSKLAKIIYTIAQKEKLSPREASIKWFRHYWQCAIEPAIKLYDLHGIALEAHQQNSILDLKNGYPGHYYYRDNQGFYLSNKRYHDLINIVPELESSESLFYDDSMIINRFSYYLFSNQLFSIINRFAADQLVSELELLQISYEQLKRLYSTSTAFGKQLIDSLINQKNISCKGNLLTRVENIDELQAENEMAAYTSIRNPFYDIEKQVASSNMKTEEVYLESA